MTFSSAPIFLAGSLFKNALRVIFSRSGIVFSSVASSEVARNLADPDPDLAGFSDPDPEGLADPEPDPELFAFLTFLPHFLITLAKAPRALSNLDGLFWTIEIIIAGTALMAVYTSVVQQVVTSEVTQSDGTMG